ncbi:MAG: hypothetical protein LH632_14795 [Rhodoferax sp.]|nr:hypothetical protein [Rhodoferax sp.]
MIKSLSVTRLLLASCLLAIGASQAQTSASGNPPASGVALDGRSDSRIERIRIEDGGARIDELRVGGETLSITVVPKGNMPAYEVLPASANRAPSAGERNGSSASGGTRVWKILGF